MRGEDFVHVRLSEAGERIADGAPVHIGGSSYHFTFQPGEAQRVTRAFEWERVLSHEQINGELLFELADEKPAVQEGNDAV